MNQQELLTLLRSGTGASYVRVSQDRHDVQRQRDGLDRWLKANGLTVPAQFRFEDEGFGRDIPHLRPDFQRMMKCAEAGLFQWIVADRQDRFGTKDKFQFIAFMHRLREAGCQFLTTDGKCWTSDDMMAFIEGGLGAETSQKEQKEKWHRILQGKISRARRGQWQGGHVAFGMDVACYTPDGNEKWRVIFEGRKLVGTKPGKGTKKRRVYALRRTKVMPDGRTEVFEGHRLFPATEHNEVLRQTPSKDQNRIAAVREVFQKYATEATCPTVLAAHLNRLGVKHYYADRWEHYHVREMLKNPIFVGFQRWNSNGQGRFHEFVGGEERPVANKNGRRERIEADWVLSDHRLFKPVVPVAVWERVQAKIKQSPPERRSPKSPGLWLSGLLYCAHCGQEMRGQQRPTRCEYFCSSYSKNKDGATCLRNAVNHKVIEDHIRRYLKQAGQEAAVFVDVHQNGNLDLLKPFEQKHWENMGQIWAIAKRMTSEVVQHPDGPMKLAKAGHYQEMANRNGTAPKNMKEYPDSVEKWWGSIRDVYRELFAQDRDDLQGRWRALDEEHTTLTERVLSLDPANGKRAIEKANARIAVLEDEMKHLEANMVNLAEDFDKRLAQLRVACDAFDAADEALSDESASTRRKAEAVRRCISRINLTFEPTGKKYPTSRLVAVEIIPNTDHDPEHPDRASF
jgi:DNA invertase Pin-like site-specific DNA recombinase